jgi:hypothetical protein
MTTGSMSERKIIQICSGENARLIALCDDGTVWLRYWGEGNGWRLIDIEDVVFNPHNQDPTSAI